MFCMELWPTKVRTEVRTYRIGPALRQLDSNPYKTVRKQRRTICSRPEQDGLLQQRCSNNSYNSGLTHNIENKAAERSMFVLGQRPRDCKVQGLKRSKYIQWDARFPCHSTVLKAVSIDISGASGSPYVVSHSRKSKQNPSLCVLLTLKSM